MPIPPPDEFGAPAPVWLLLFLLYLTFALHLVVMNFTLAGGLLWPVLRIAGAKNPLLSRLADTTLAILPVAVSFTITTGVAPLLFVQVLYGQFFYTSNVLLGWRWLALLGLLLAAFYWVYWMLGRRGGWKDRPVLAGVVGLPPAVLFLGIAWIMANNAVLSIRPGLWGLFDAAGSGSRLYVPDPMTLPRFLHMVVGAVGVAGLWIVGIGWYARLRHGDDEFRRQCTRLGLLVVLVSTFLQIAVGLWLLLAVGQDGRGGLLAGSAGAVVWMVALAAAVGLLMLTFRALIAPDNRRLTLAVCGVMLAVLIGMMVGRQTLRAHLLADFYTTAELAVRTQASPMFLFFVVLVAGLATVFVMLKWCWQSARS